VNTLLAKSQVEDISIVENSVILCQQVISFTCCSKFPTDQQYNDWMGQAIAGDKRVKDKSKLPPLNPFFYYQRRRLRQSYQSYIDESLQNPSSDRVDLANFLKVHRPDVRFLGEEICEILFGGAYSTGSTVGNALYLLARNPKYIQRLRKELEGIKEWNYEALMNAKFLDAVIRETQRLTSPVPFWTRTSPVEQDIELANGKICPKNTMLFISNYTLMRSESHYAQAHQFRPERWLDDNFKANHDYGSEFYCPQGAGPRQCKGLPFSKVINRVCVAAIVAKLDLLSSAVPDLGYRYFFGTNVPTGPKGRFVPYEADRYE